MTSRRPVSDGDIHRLATEFTDTHTQLPAMWRRFTELHHDLWIRHTTSSDTAIVQTSGHGDPTGDTVAASEHARGRMGDVRDQMLTAFALLRGAWAAMDRITGTIAGYDGTQAAADQAVAHTTRSRCSVCNDHAATRRGRCNTCHAWYVRHGTERPTDQHHRAAHR